MLERVRAGCAAGVLAGVLAGCVPVGEPVPGGGPVVGPVGGGGVNQCGALDLQYLIGAPARDLEAIQFNKPVRVIYPGSAVTMDFNPDRLNFEIDRAGRVARVTCG